MNGYGNGRPVLSGWAGKYINAIITSDRVYLSQGASLDYSVANTKHGSLDGKIWAIGASNDKVPAEIGKRAITGDYYAFRVYNRALTAPELARNMKVDEIRFRGNTAPYRDVVVATVEPVEGVSVESSVPDGEYEVTDQWTFTAETVVIDGKKFVPKYTLETWGATEWVNPVTVYSDQYTHTAGATPVRITWEWSLYQGTALIVK